MTAWFAQLDLTGTTEAQRRVIQRVGDLLDQLQPARLDPARQVVEREDGETWVKLRHDSEPWMETRFVLTDGWVNFYGVMGHDEAYSVHPEPRDSWETETIDILADLLQSTSTVETYTLRGKPWRDVRTISAPYDTDDTPSTVLRSLTSALPLGRWAEHGGTRSANFGCRGSRPSRD